MDFIRFLPLKNTSSAGGRDPELEHSNSALCPALSFLSICVRLTVRGLTGKERTQLMQLFGESPSGTQSLGGKIDVFKKSFLF